MILHELTLPAGVPIQMLDQTTDEMGVDNDPPKGMLIHTHFESDGRVRVLDIWESQDAFDAFNRDRLGPAMAKVGQANGMDPSSGPQPEVVITELHRVVRGTA